jgi:hypothetical protein
VADAFEVMTSPRPYSKPMSTAAAREELAKCAGTHFDPQVVRALLNISLGRLRKAMGAIAWFTQVPLLASMPRLSAALIQGGQQAAAGAGGAIGVVAVSTVPTAAHVHAHQVAQHHKPVPVVQQSTAPVDPLAAVLALTGRRTPSQTVAVPTPSASHGKSAAHRANGKHHGKGSTHAHSPSASAGHGVASTKGRQNAAVKRHHGQAHHDATKATPTQTSTPGRCGSNRGSGVGNGGGANTNTHSHNVQPGVTPAPGLTRCH